MTGNTELLLKALFNADSLDEIPLERVQELVDTYPSFHPGHFFLSKKLQLEQDDGFAKHTLRTALHFNNPFWLQWLLMDHFDEPMHSLVDPTVAGNETLPTHHTPVEAFTELVAGPQPVAMNQSAEENSLAMEAKGSEPIPIPETSLTYVESEWNEPMREGQESTLEMDTWTEARFRAGTDFPTTTPLTVTPGQDTEVPWPEGSENMAAPEKVEYMVTDGEVEPMDLAEDIAGTELAALEKTEALDDDHGAIRDVEEEPLVKETISKEVLTGQSEPSAAEQEEVLAFEPYFTIDYFASQGIRLPVDDAPADRFSQQLKSFTDWLKTMKRLPLTAALTETSETEESDLQSIAERSNEEKDVLTETMAEVLVKQGKFQRAIDLYQKLSLLNPSKSAYFAARIEELKNLLT